MAATLTLVTGAENFFGRLRSNTGDLALDTSYPAGGYVLSLNDWGLKIAPVALITPANAASGAYQYVYIPSTNAVRVFVTSTGLEVGTGTSLSTVTIRIMLMGL